jgi:serine/threonine-protein kinase
MVEPFDSPTHLFRFSVFELDPRSGELRKAGRRIALQDHSLRILVRLLDRPGELVTRDELRGLLWPGDTFVDFERGLNTAVKRLRDALGDDADTPRFIETLPRRGYRFITPVERREPVLAGGADENTRPPTRGVRAMGIPVAIAVALGLLASAMVLVTGSPAGDPVSTPVAHLLASVSPADQLLSAEVMDTAPTVGFGRPSRTAIAISPDGRQLVFSARRGDSQMLYARPIDQPDARPLPGTEGADSPFFSPDGRWVGFWADGTIRKVPAAGGPVVTITNLAPPPHAPSAFGSSDPPLFGASWGSDDVIVFSLERSGLWEVPASGGAPAALTGLEPGEVSHRLPHVLPGAAAVLFTTRTRMFGDWERARIEVYVRATGERSVVVEGGADGRHVSTGHLLYVRSGTLLAVPFDASRLEVKGDPVGMIDGVMHAVFGDNSRIDTGAAQLAVSNTGTLVYVPGGVYPTVGGRLVWVNRRGEVEPVGTPPGVPGWLPRLSPDGRRVALARCSNPEQACPEDVWTYDLDRGQAARMTFGGGANWPVWTHDGRRIAFARDMRGPPGIFWIPADGSGSPTPLVETAEANIPAAWSPAHAALIFARRGAQTQWDIWALFSGPDTLEARPLVQTEFDELNPVLSPDGRWLAYVSTKSGEGQVYVQPFPGPGMTYQISNGGGDDPSWGPGGREIFFIAGPPGKKTMMAAPVRTQPEFAVGPATPLFEMNRHGRPLHRAAPANAHDVAPDGRFLMVLVDEPPPPEPVTQFHVVLNWHEELKAKVRPRR